MSDKNTYQQEEQIRRYVQNEMTNAECNAFEREMQKDPFLADAVEGFSTFSSNEIFVDIESLKNKVRNDRHGRQRYIWYAAASVLLIVVSTFFLFNMEEKSNLMVSENTAIKEELSSPEQINNNETEELLNIETAEPQNPVQKQRTPDSEISEMEILDQEMEFVPVVVDTDAKQSSVVKNPSESLKLKRSPALGENIKSLKAKNKEQEVSVEVAETADTFSDKAFCTGSVDKRAGQENKNFGTTITPVGIQRTSDVYDG